MQNLWHIFVEIFCSAFKKIIHDATAPSFQEVGGVTKFLIFHQRRRISHGIKLTTTESIDFYSQGIVFATVFN